MSPKVTFSLKRSKHRKPEDGPTVVTVHEEGGDASLVAVIPDGDEDELESIAPSAPPVPREVEPSAEVAPYFMHPTAVWVTMPRRFARKPPLVRCARCGHDVPGFYVLVGHDDGTTTDEHVLPYPHEH